MPVVVGWCAHTESADLWGRRLPGCRTAFDSIPDVAFQWCDGGGAVEGGVRMVRTREGMEMDVFETPGFGGQCGVGIAAMDDLGGRRGDSG
jgi:hypothetical protein